MVQKLNILAVEAHPDDVELLCSGTLARMAALGHEIAILSLTAGELGSMESPPRLFVGPYGERHG